MHDGSVFKVSVDTSSLSKQSGFLDFQFNPGDSSAEAAIASVTLFQTVCPIPTEAKHYS